MNSWRPYPLLRLLIPFITGTLAGLALNSPAGLVPGMMASQLLLLVALLLLLRFYKGFRFRWVFGLLVVLFLSMTGFGLTVVSREIYRSKGQQENPDGLLLGQISEPPVAASYGWKTILRLNGRFRNGRWYPLEMKILAYLKAGEEQQDLHYGELIFLHSAIDSIRDNSNPYSFNYASYLRKKEIFRRTFAEEWQWKKAAHQNSEGLRQFAFRMRDNLLDLLRKYGLKGDEFAVAAALLLGYTADLRPEIMKNYAASGAMHILSVSGMHVGVIYLFLELMLGFMNRRRWGRWVKAILILMLIWFYACMTGLAPCVLRAAIMITLPIIARSMSRVPDMINVIAASLMLMVALEPMVLHDIGFRLSYMAVTGLVILYKPIYDLYVTSAWLPDKIWSLMAVSIAAQVATLPVTLYVFHQFPNYFLLTNLVVVPLSSIIIYTGIVLMAMGTIPVVAGVIATSLSYMIRCLNHAIAFIEGLPWSTASGIYISAFASLLLCLAIILLLMLWMKRETGFLICFLVCLNVMLILSLCEKSRQGGSTRFVFFNTGKFPLMAFVKGDRMALIYGSGRSRDLSGLVRYQSVIQNYRDALGIRQARYYWKPSFGRCQEKDHNFIPVVTGGRFLQLDGFRICLLQGSIPESLKGNMDVHLLIISGNPKVTAARIVSVFNAGCVLLDGTNYPSKVRKWQKELRVSGVPVHAVQMDGAYEKEIEKVFGE